MITYDILIPAFNAEQHIPQLLEQISRLDQKPGAIFLVDDGSVDATSEIARQFDALVLQWHENHGKGAALRAGYDLFLKNSKNDYLLCMDADLQHPVHCISDFLVVARKFECPIIIGDRQKKPGMMPFHRILSNHLTSLILSVFTGQKIRDSQCGFRLIHRTVLQSLKNRLKENGFQFESEFLIRSAGMNYPIRFIPVPTLYGKEKSSIKNVFDTFRFIRFIIREAVTRA